MHETGQLFPHTNMILAETINLPVSWIISSFLSLGGVISLLAKILWSQMQNQLKLYREQLEEAEKRIERVEHINTTLQSEVNRLILGCGHPECEWRKKR